MQLYDLIKTKKIINYKMIRVLSIILLNNLRFKKKNVFYFFYDAIIIQIIPSEIIQLYNKIII